MTASLQVFYSNRLEVLYQQLKGQLFGGEHPPLMRRIVVVYGPAMKLWVTLRMAQDPDLNIATGIEFLYLSQAFGVLAQLTTVPLSGHMPSHYELALAIEKECMKVISDYKNMPPIDQNEWSPLIQHLKINPHRVYAAGRLTRKIQKRLISLSQHLARLFLEYGRFAPEMIRRWEQPAFPGWQAELWRKIFLGELRWSYPARSLMSEGVPTTPFSLHFFSISFVTQSEFTFINRLARQVSVCYYLISPCALFWSDIRSDRENAYLQAYWQKRFGLLSSKVENLEEFLSDRNPLLANFGRMGREMARQIEESQAITYANYLLPEHVKEMGEELFDHDDLSFEDAAGSLSLLHAVQADLLMMRNPKNAPPIEIKEATSIQLHIAPTKRREVEILYNNLLRLMEQDPSLTPGDIIVMAPQIADYVPYIESQFVGGGSRLDYQVLDLGMDSQSEIVQGFLQMLRLSESRWDAASMLQLFGHPSFQRRHELTPSDERMIQGWIEQAGIRWGDDWIHRNELLYKRYCEQGMVEETAVGTWDYGMTRLLYGLTTVPDDDQEVVGDTPPCGGVEFSQSELLGKWIRLLHSLRDDLSPLEDQSNMTIEDWVNFMSHLLENYFCPDFADATSVNDYETLKRQFDALRRSGRFFPEDTYSFSTIKAHLLSLLQQRGITYREEYLQTVRFCSLIPLRSIPARVIVLIGMQEGAFPRTDHHSSLNLMVGCKDVHYSPLSADYDRYLFLEAVHSAKDYLFFSYQGYNAVDNKELQPSLIIEEFFSYLDKHYTVNGKQVSQLCIFKHPFDGFDSCYFSRRGGFHSYSSDMFRAAQAFNLRDKEPHHRFIDQFTCRVRPVQEILENKSVVEVRHLAAVMRNPVKFYLNRGLDITIETEDERILKTEEEIIISPLDRHILKQYALRDDFNRVLYRAEREGKLPFGLFKTLAAKRLYEEVEDVKEKLNKHGIVPDHFFQIEFSLGCTEPMQLKEDLWLLPPAKIDFDNDFALSIEGKVSLATGKGLISLSKGSLADAWKTWPQFLLYCYAAQQIPGLLNPQLIFSHDTHPKKAFFENPQKYLKSVIHYYSLCLHHFSPLFPDWISLILNEDEEALQKKIEETFNNSFGGYPNYELRWTLNPHSFPSAELMIKEWKPCADELFKDVLQFWYS